MIRRGKLSSKPLCLSDNTQCCAGESSRTIERESDHRTVKRVQLMNNLSRICVSGKGKRDSREATKSFACVLDIYCLDQINSINNCSLSLLEIFFSKITTEPLLLFTQPKAHDDAITRSKAPFSSNAYHLIFAFETLFLLT